MSDAHDDVDFILKQSLAVFVAATILALVLGLSFQSAIGVGIILALLAGFFSFKALFGSDSEATTYNLDDLRSVDPEELEEIVAEAFEKEGWETELTEQTGDRGADVILRDGPETAIVEVKRYSEGRNIGEEPVARLVGAMSYYHANQSFFVTTSSFTDAAYDYSEQANAEINLVNGDELVEMLDK